MARGFQTKADKAFESKVEAAIRDHDWRRVEQLTAWYEGYQLLICEDEVAVQAHLDKINRLALVKS